MKFIIIAAAALLFSGVAGAAEIKVLSTQATEEAYRELVPLFEQASGHKVTTIFTGTLDVQKIIGGIWPLNDWHEAFEKMHSGAIVKAVLTPSG